MNFSVAYVYFETDENGVGKGFNISYREAKCQSILFTSLEEFRVSAQCGATLSLSSDKDDNIFYETKIDGPFFQTLEIIQQPMIFSRQKEREDDKMSMVHQGTGQSANRARIFVGLKINLQKIGNIQELQHRLEEARLFGFVLGDTRRRHFGEM